ncbi:MAG: hypothetical protein LAP21_18750 [Acidobacteriia bacterium]|nr:hypothetical protein [Terriglobia bacterium]
MNAAEIRAKWKKQEEDLQKYFPAVMKPGKAPNEGDLMPQLFFNSLLVNGWICSEIAAQHAETNARNTEAETRANAAEQLLSEIQAQWTAFQQQNSGALVVPATRVVQVKNS